MVTDDEKGNLDFNVVMNGRYYYKTQYLQELAQGKPKQVKSKFCTEWGSVEQKSPLVQISPALDLVDSCPSDPCYSE
jgi:hypothetical protein